MKPLTPNELRLAAELLNLAADEFSNHGCNDFERPKWMPQAEWDAIELDFYTRDGHPEDHEPGRKYGYDWILMRHLAARLKEAAGGA